MAARARRAGVRRAVHGPRSVQGRERRLRPRCGRRSAAPGSAAAAAARAAGRLHRAPGQRRVRHPAERGLLACRRDHAGAAHGGAAVRALRARWTPDPVRRERGCRDPGHRRDRRRRAHAEGRARALPRQVERPRSLQLLRRCARAAAAAATHPLDRPARGDRLTGHLAALPGSVCRMRRGADRLRGAAALDAPHARQRAAVRVHSARGGARAHRRAWPLGARAGLRRGLDVAAAALGIGEPVRRAVP